MCNYNSVGRYLKNNTKDHVWYIKWASAFTIICAMFLHVFGVTPWNSIVQLVGAAGWVYVGFQWRERAIITNFLPLMQLVRYFGQFLLPWQVITQQISPG